MGFALVRLFPAEAGIGGKKRGKICGDHERLEPQQLAKSSFRGFLQGLEVNL